jgi:hypothetical protein
MISAGAFCRTTGERTDNGKSLMVIKSTTIGFEQSGISILRAYRVALRKLSRPILGQLSLN